MMDLKYGAVLLSLALLSALSGCAAPGGAAYASIAA